MIIGQLASITGSGAETIRYYERCGLLPKPKRLASGYRIYDDGTANRIKFIKEAKTLGFTLKEISSLFALTDDLDADCATVNKKAQYKITEIEQKIDKLSQMKEALEILTRICPDDEQPLSECSIINHLYGKTER